MVQDTRKPTGKMDFDTEDRLLPANHYRYAKNGRSGTSDRDGEGAVENIRGNVLRGTTTFNRGTVIGSCPDVKNNAVIFFRKKAGDILVTYTSATRISATEIQVVNPNVGLSLGEEIRIQQTSNTFNAVIVSRVGDVYTISLKSGTFPAQSIVSINLVTNNVIVRYFEDTQTFQFLTNPGLMGDVLNFTGMIYNPRVIESSFGQLLTWVQYPDGEPCLMNIDRMKVGAEYFNVADSEIYISLAKSPPECPTISLVEDTTMQGNSISNRYFQFAVSYVYEDGQESSLSEFSEISLLTQSNFIGNPTEARFYNAIDIVFNTGYYVKTVNLYRREGNGVSETGTTNPTWYRWGTYEVTLSNSFATQRFYNTEQITPLSRIASDKLFDSVPILADCIEVTQDNQVVLASLTEGYDAESITIDTDAVFTTYDQIVTSPFFPNDVKWKRIGELLNATQMRLYREGPDFPGDPPEYEEGDLLIVKVIKDIATPNQRIYLYKRVLTATDVATTLSSYITWLSAEFTADGISHTITPTGSFSYFIELTGVGYQYYDMFVNKGGTDWVVCYANNFTRTSFKEGATHDWIIIHCDEYMRQGPAQLLDSVYVPTIVQRYPVSSSFNYVQQSVAMRFKLYNQPPLWAKYYILAHRGSIAKTQSFIVNSITQSGDGVIINFKKCYDNLVENGTVFDFEDYGTDGTKVRFLTRKYTYASTQIAAQRVVSTVDTFYQVSSYDATDKEIFIDNIVLSDISPEIGVGSLFEIYLESKSDFYFKRYIGTVTDAGEPTRQYDTYNALDGYATTVISQGDSYRFWRNLKYDSEANADTPIYHVESFSISNTVDSPYNGKGRPQIETPNAKRQKLINLIRWSGKLINLTQVNNLSTWDEGNFNAEINSRFGAIIGMRQIGYTLKIVQWANINSAFIGRRELQNADGSTNLVVTDNLIGTINPSEREFGTKYPGSIISTGQRLYYFDSLKSKYIVDDGNGVNEIALYGGPDGGANSTMSKYFRQLANTINASSNYDIITGFDYLYRDMYVTITNRALNTQETLYYNETQNAWKYFIDMEHVNAAGDVKYIPDFYGNVGQSFFAFMLGNTFQFNKAVAGGLPAYSQLFKFNVDDPVKKLVIETVGMIEPDKVKVFLTHALHANLSPELVEITVPPNQMYPNGMYTRLKPGNYKYREGVFYADIKRDAYTKGFTTDETVIKNLIANGRPMRGHVCVVRITFSTSDYCKLFTTSIGMIPSELS
jgi:hypothetical protein